MPKLEDKILEKEEIEEEIEGIKYVGSNPLIKFAVVAGVILILALIILTSFFFKRNEIVKLLHDGNTDSAYSILKKHGKGNKEIEEFVFEEAQKLYYDGEYEKSYVLLEKLGKNDIIIKTKYNRAVQAINDKDYENAFSLLRDFDYKDSIKLMQTVLEAHPEYAFKNKDVNNTIYFGKYEQDNNFENGAEPIEWEIISKDGNKALVLSKKCLDMKSYDEKSKLDNWGKSTIRKWLNNEFLNTALSKDEQKLIIPTYLKDVGTTDKLFLLSIVEVKKYDFLKSAKATQYSLSKGLICKNDSTCGWLLRSSLNTKYVNIIDFDAEDSVQSVENLSGVRVALWIDLNKTK